ncbi:DUF485 domain-containing protein [Streptomyces echinatus]|uniref:Uncharacterized membrane protein (DUF485 family) n=1 Tax=Streptomyces echinatus TaxID=67293 RepID=A0A7W9UP04_9ACTN|nr:DUF485 domain-containing protein [Streptomyces echinatus]MBB5925832.1 uncharacterized membrane protein (DUF485 family) [Streptomyces echinatus]
MTDPYDNRYPPAASPDRTQPRTEPHGSAPRRAPYGRDPWQEPYGQQLPQDTSYGSYPYDGAPSYDAFGQAPQRPPHTREAHPHGADLAGLRSAYKVLRRVSTLTALGSFVVYVALSCGAPDLMGSKIAGELSLGMALGILQLLVTFAAVFWYGRSARHSVDPLARAVRERTVRPGRDAGVAG